MFALLALLTLAAPLEPPTSTEPPPESTSTTTTTTTTTSAEPPTPTAATSPRTPEQEVEAWAPDRDVVVRRRPDGPRRRDRTDVASETTLPAVLGTGAGIIIGGTSAYITAALLSSVALDPVALQVVALVVAGVALGGAPAGALLLVGPAEFPAWGAPVVGASAVAGGALGAGVALVVVPPLLEALRAPGDDCVACGGPGFAVFFGVPALTVVGGAFVGAVGSALVVAGAAPTDELNALDARHGR